MEKNEECTAITAHVFLVLNTLFVLSVFRENRWTKSAAAFFGCWLIVFLYGLQWLIYFGGEKGWLIHLRRWYYCAILLQIARHIDCIFFSFFCIKVSRFLPENMLKIKSSRGAEKPWKKPNKRKADLERTRQNYFCLSLLNYS